jgi:hypothetical protein
MGRRYFEWASLALVMVELGALGCNRSGRGRRHDEQPSGIVSPSEGELGRRRAIGGGPRPADDDGGVTSPQQLEDLDPDELQFSDAGSTGMTTGTTGMTATTGTGTTGTGTTGTTTGTGTTGTGTETTGTGTTGTGTTGTGTTGTGTTGTGTTGTGTTGTTGTGTTGTMSTTVTGAGSRI